ncbi:MAG TPA: sigma-54-dependent Fis family transcriptional regulator [Flavobacteriales bacterium]|nr:sigma-54-dependent Fis family transcriptional regulator [Flavobacteriales bacterium]
MTIQQIKQRFEILGTSPLLDRAIDTAMQVAPTDISVLVSGESGVGKEVFPQIIHLLSARKHGEYIAVNCGAIPEGTIDSELFGHEKGSFTGAHEARKGYFEVANGGTIFLDEVAELPLQTQVRLLRVLETGEYIKVGSSKVQKTDVRIVAATNVDIPEAISREKFREDLYYRLNTVPINLAPLRERKEDIHLFFRKFAADFADKYRMPTIKLNEEAQGMLSSYRWPGNVRQIKNVAEQISVIEENRNINKEVLSKYLPESQGDNLPILFSKSRAETGNLSDREILYKILFDMKNDVTDLKKLVYGMLQGRDGSQGVSQEGQEILKDMIKATDAESSSAEVLKPEEFQQSVPAREEDPSPNKSLEEMQEVEEIIEESLSLQDMEIELIQKALVKHKSNKSAANELGISERTLYRKIKEYNIK